MAQNVCPLVSAEDRARLEAVVADRSRAQKHVARARIILGSADRLTVAEVARRARVGRPAVWRWQRRFAARRSGPPTKGGPGSQARGSRACRATRPGGPARRP
jgi:hypothetical protein